MIAPPTTNHHGPECLLSDFEAHPWTRNSGRWQRVGLSGPNRCECVACHCADLADPTGPFGSCRRCHRKQVATPSHTPTTDDPVDMAAPAEALGVSGPSPRTAGRSDGGQA